MSRINLRFCELCKKRKDATKPESETEVKNMKNREKAIGIKGWRFFEREYGEKKE